MDFTHLHIHDELGSLLDGAIRVPEVSATAKELGMSSIAVSNHGSLASCLQHYEQSKKIGIKPIFALEAYITEDKDGLPNQLKTRDNYHMILIAKDAEGWKNLMRLNSIAYEKNFYHKPRISIDNLADYSKGIIASSACLAGLCSRFATYDEINNKYWDKDHKVELKIDYFKEIFYGQYYLEVMDNSMPQQLAYNSFLLEMSKKTNTKMIITSDAHYRTKEDEELHSMLMAMQTKRSIKDYKENGYFHYENCYIRTPQEMLDAAKKIGCEDAFHNTLEISDQVNIELELDTFKLPLFDIQNDPDYQDYLAEGCTHDK